jgi:hypothetical protein
MKLSNAIKDKHYCEYEVFRDGSLERCGEVASFKFRRSYLCKDCAEIVSAFGFKNEVRLIDD